MSGNNPFSFFLMRSLVVTLFFRFLTDLIRFQILRCNEKWQTEVLPKVRHNVRNKMEGVPDAPKWGD